ncbi:MAG TPA: polysaccharide biosynthesis tyrosine autokinase [Bryobacteraceae bacterium]|jgi:capsular exopolysaccharide synthesis family protein|nr:polysaccharide biosynthesis tyrosine autokinase [Bryobacteraceae bacterium]
MGSNALSSAQTEASSPGEYGGDALAPGSILARRKWFILLAVVAGGAAAWGFSASQTPVYEAQATLEVQELNQDFLKTGDFSPIGDAGSRFGALTDIQTQIRILQSESLLEQAAASIGLNAPATQQPGARDAWLRKLEEQVQIRSANLTRVIDVVVDQENPRAAADLANALSRQYMQRNVEARSAITAKTAELLNQQLADMRARLEESDDALQDYARRNDLVITGDKQNISDQKLREIETELSRAESDRAAKQSHWEIEQNASPESLPELMDDREYRDVGFRLEDLKAQEAQLDATYQKDYRKNVQTHASIVALEEAQVARRKAVLDRIHNDYLDALGRERLLRENYRRQAGIVTRDNENAIRYNMLKRDADANQELYETLNQKVRQSDFTRAVPSGNVRIVDSARSPQRPIRPRTPLNVFAGILGGLVFGIAFAVVGERGDKTFREPGAASQLLGVPELGVVPHGRKKTRSRGMAEACGGIATSVIFAGTDPATKLHSPSVYVVTSAGPDEGKTTVCCNLALALAENRMKILLIDADLQKPQVHERFGAPNDRGLIQLLENGVDSISESIRDIDTSGLSILPSGGLSSSGTELLASPNLSEILRRVRQSYDVVLIDTPPILLLPSGRLVGRLSDGVILVVHAGETTKRAALAACERLRSDEIPLVGTILNNLDPKFAPYGAYGYGKNR